MPQPLYPISDRIKNMQTAGPGGVQMPQNPPDFYNYIPELGRIHREMVDQGENTDYWDQEYNRLYQNKKRLLNVPHEETIKQKVLEGYNPRIKNRMVRGEEYASPYDRWVRSKESVIGRRDELGNLLTNMRETWADAGQRNERLGASGGGRERIALELFKEQIRNPKNPNNKYWKNFRKGGRVRTLRRGGRDHHPTLDWKKLMYYWRSVNGF